MVNCIFIIKTNYNNFTQIEKNIADFFINNTEEMDFSLKSLSEKLFVSEASLHRFVKKCGYNGYREFIYSYTMYLRMNKNPESNYILELYQEVINKTFEIINDEQVNMLAKYIQNSEKVFVYGKGSSKIAGDEVKLRFLRVGVDIESTSDYHLMIMQSAIINENTLVIGISLSGETKEVMESVKNARKHGAKTVLITSKYNEKLIKEYDLVIIVPLIKYLENINYISRQIPILIFFDMVYNKFLLIDKKNKEIKYEHTRKNVRESFW